MLAAGLSHVQGPGHKHASEIARLALDLLNSVLQLKNPCSPGNNKVELRIGINTGKINYLEMWIRICHGRLFYVKYYEEVFNVVKLHNISRSVLRCVHNVVI